jgi:hypothetical protein
MPRRTRLMAAAVAAGAALDTPENVHRTSVSAAATESGEAASHAFVEPRPYECCA